MLGIGFGEFALVILVLIVFLGPERLPAFMKTVGKGIRSLRQASRDIRSAVGIDELMRDDLTYRPPVRRSAPASDEAKPADKTLNHTPPDTASALPTDTAPSESVEVAASKPGAPPPPLPTRPGLPRPVPMAVSRSEALPPPPSAPPPPAGGPGTPRDET